MLQFKPWCWELLADGHGPDWFFLSEVTPSSSDAIARVISTLSLSGFTSYPQVKQYCTIHQQVCVSHAFIDTSNASMYRANLSGTEQRNIWVYDLLQFHSNVLEIECGYGGRGATYHESETAVLMELLSLADVTLLSWKVQAGGNGYDYRTIREGRDIGSLTGYLS